MSDVSVTVTRDHLGAYVARNADGVELRFGEDGFSAVELLLVALAGCAAIDVDHATSRHDEPERFEVTAAARKVTEGGNHLEDVQVDFDVAFGTGPGADRAGAVLPRALRVSHDSSCTVSGTLEAATPVLMRLV